jgi:hypothetical protein
VTIAVRPRRIYGRASVLLSNAGFAAMNHSNAGKVILSRNLWLRCPVSDLQRICSGLIWLFSCDRFVSNYVLDLLPSNDIVLLLAEAHRLLTADGRCVSSVGRVE